MDPAALFTYLAPGLVLGASAGLSPGPLQALVVSETLRYGRREGLKVAFAPLVTDPPIVAASIFLMARLAGFAPVLGLVSLAGACFLAYLAWENLTTRPESKEEEARLPSLRKAVITNLLSPMPYNFWFFVAAPTTVAAWEEGGFVPAAVFVAVFYAVLVGTLLAISVVVARSRSLVTGGGYVLVMRVIGAALLVLAVIFLRKGLTLLEIF